MLIDGESFKNEEKVLRMIKRRRSVIQIQNIGYVATQESLIITARYE